MKLRKLAVAPLLWMLAGFVAGAAPSQAQDGYPSRSIKLVVPFGVGGITDVVARLVGQRLSEQLQQSVIVENRPGAGGSVAAQAVTQAEPDGYTLLLGTVGTQVVNKMIYARLAYEPAAFVPISLISNSPYVLAVNSALGSRSLSELVEYARRNPEKLAFGSAGHGSSPHLGLELLKSLTGVKILHVPFKSGGDAVNNALTGQIQIVFDAIPVVMPQAAGGGLTALAIAQQKRNPSVPELKTTAEQGLEGLQIGSWNALLAPAGTPQPRIERLSQALERVLAEAAVVEKFRSLGIEPMPSGPDAYRRHVAVETERWSQVVATAKITVD